MARRNPWTKKNPFLSLWLSGANAMTGAARGQAQAALTRQMTEANKAAIEAATQMLWGAWMPPPPKPVARKRSRRK